MKHAGFFQRQAAAGKISFYTVIYQCSKQSLLSISFEKFCRSYLELLFRICILRNKLSIDEHCMNHD